MAMNATVLSVEEIIKDQQLKKIQLKFNRDNKDQER